MFVAPLITRSIAHTVTAETPNRRWTRLIADQEIERRYRVKSSPQEWVRVKEREQEKSEARGNSILAARGTETGPCPNLVMCNRTFP